MEPLMIAAAQAVSLKGAKTHAMPVLLANHGSESGGYPSAGRSAIWDEKGKLPRPCPQTPGPRWSLPRKNQAVGQASRAAHRITQMKSDT